MVDEPSNGNELRELGDPTVVVMMEVRDEQVIDLFDARFVGSRQYSIRISSPTRLNRAIVGVGTIPRPTRVDEQRVPVGRDNEGGLATLHIDEVDIERLRRRSLRPRSPCNEGQEQ